MNIVENISYKDVSILLKKGNIVCLFQGKSESGPRSLGNRSILFNPTIKGMNDTVNMLKCREKYRPVAGTILEENVDEWFDMMGIKSSPYMSYAVEVFEEKIDKISAVCHVDGTCRIQTVSKEQNKHYYNLIKSFYFITGIPILGNTSFNLAGEPLVETLDDAYSTFYKSKIPYLFLPEKNQLVVNKKYYESTRN